MNKSEDNMKMEREKIALSPEERETIVLFNDGGKECTVYTCSRPVMTKLDKLCKSNPKSWELIKQDLESKTYRTTKNLISFRADSVKREMTEEQRAKASELMKNINKRKPQNSVFAEIHDS